MITLVYVYLAWSSVADYFAQAGSVGAGIGSFVALIPLLLLADLLFTADRSSVLLRETGPLKKAVLILLATGLVSWLVNDGSLANAVRFLYSILRILIVFLWVLLSGRTSEIRRFVLKLVAVLVIVQLPFFAYGFATRGRGYVGDFARGAVITGSAYEVALYMYLGILVVVALYLSTREKRYLLYGLASLFLLAATSTKQIILVVPLVLLFIVWRFERVRILRAGIALVVFVVVFLGVYRYAQNLWAVVQADQLAMDGTEETGLLSFTDLILSSEKYEGYRSAFVDVPSELPFPLVGAGPGNYASYTAMNARTPLARRYITDYLDQIPDGAFGTLVSRTSGIIALYGDLGVVGLACMLYVYGLVFVRVLRKGDAEVSPEGKALLFIVLGSGLLIGVESLLLNIFEGASFLLNTYWIAAGSYLGEPAAVTLLRLTGRSMKVAIYSYHLFEMLDRPDALAGGMELQSLLLGRALASRGVEVEFLVGDTGQREVEFREGLTFRRLILRTGSPWHKVRRFIGALRLRRRRSWSSAGRRTSPGSCT